MDQTIQSGAAPVMFPTKIVGEQTGGLADIMDQLGEARSGVSGMMVHYKPIRLIEARLESHVTHPGRSFIERTLFPILIVEGQQSRLGLKQFFRKTLQQQSRD